MDCFWILNTYSEFLQVNTFRDIKKCRSFCKICWFVVCKCFRFVQVYNFDLWYRVKWCRDQITLHQWLFNWNVREMPAISQSCFLSIFSLQNLSAFFYFHLSLSSMRIVISYPHSEGLYPFTTQSRLLTTWRRKIFKNIVGTGENAAFSPFPTMFSTLSKQILIFVIHLFCCLQLLWIWINLKCCCLVKG